MGRQVVKINVKCFTYYLFTTKNELVYQCAVSHRGTVVHSVGSRLEFRNSDDGKSEKITMSNVLKLCHLSSRDIFITIIKKLSNTSSVRFDLFQLNINVVCGKKMPDYFVWFEIRGLRLECINCQWKGVMPFTMKYWYQSWCIH